MEGKQGGRESVEWLRAQWAIVEEANAKSYSVRVQNTAAQQGGRPESQRTADSAGQGGAPGSSQTEQRTK
jgi:hypothetical protein